MGVVTKTIGTSSRNYSTMQAWEDALPANLVTDGNSQVGECYNDSQFTGVVNFSGSVVDATNNVTLTAASGQSFQDNVNVRTARLAYNTSNGVHINLTSTGLTLFTRGYDHIVIKRLQVKYTTNYERIIDENGINRTNCIIQDCIFAVRGYLGKMTSGKMRNVLAYSTFTQFSLTTDYAGTNTTFLENCTFVTPSNITPLGSIIGANSGAPSARNCALFGCLTVQNFKNLFTGNNNACEQNINFGTSNQSSVTYANQFEQSSTASNLEDFRLKTGSNCIDTGATLTLATDISNTSRSGSWDIGAWETTAAPTSFPPVSVGMKMPFLAM